jgi:glutamate 5-kinase
MAAMTPSFARNQPPRLSDYKRLVVKLGSALLVEASKGTIKTAFLRSVIEDIARLRSLGCDIIIVSSGSIALGRTVLPLPQRALKLEESQAAASVGQIALAQAYHTICAEKDIISSQILITLEDTENRRRYLNARSTMDTLLKLGVVPVVNENDTIATSEIRYGDNDRLAARVAAMMSASALILLSDVDGLYTAPPHNDPEAKLIPVIEAITSDILAMAQDTHSGLSRGGMKTKIEAAQMATQAGASMIIASGKTLNPLQAIENGAPHSLFLPQNTPHNARKRWIAGSMDAQGSLSIDEGAVKAIKKGKSLLAAGIVSSSGDYKRGDTVKILDIRAQLIGYGLIGYDHEDIDLIKGQHSDKIEPLLGYSSRRAVIHRDDMALL